MSEISEAPESPGITIGISGPARRSTAHRLINLGLRLHGAHTHYIRPGSSTDVSLLDGLVLSGGTHVHPNRYGQQPQVTARYDLKRDETDFTLLEQAEEIDIPVLGICRGAQFINVFHGGSLCQNVTPLRMKTRHRPLLLPLQTVQLVQDSRIGRLMHSTLIGANRIHSQAIKHLGRNLRVTALDNDLFVQAIENTGQQWLMGVQWHPEYLLYHTGHRRIFSHFVHAARARKLERLQSQDMAFGQQGD
ncbi:MULTISPECIES: gamma-glutamyl-gamma-aminobutyrate hydrolase family protein [unclassified Marinobacter]|uniref:gamma-glutamyl-gamma-aminobutyrate hydrolase family protein n=1 Tax=unclassified Marinobacter TaxID=83889 RepID=UPI000718BDC9|nr:MULTISPECIES: type 1 glutamine amidotransferase [unclassified Marinobacter]MDX5441146.1 type 1 glutamine amidotransferase [Alteromonadaceae bacterium]AMQ90562.1 peptidase C26 [Marinobacter sp. LQ44]MDX5336776.1 type 1 glutamine amidotransferase [Marinobacter sp.]MDX5387934.1 type 1 glutamine amidotransferase [Marinobacter sp.]MDX5473230.1 type 1 glutamine amidotransferase [Marinobacter sp.]